MSSSQYTSVALFRGPAHVFVTGPAYLEVDLGLLLAESSGLWDNTHGVGLWTGVRVISEVTGSFVKLEVVTELVDGLFDGVIGVTVVGEALIAEVTSVEGLVTGELKLELELDLDFDEVEVKPESDEVGVGVPEISKAVNDANQSGTLPPPLPNTGASTEKRTSGSGIIAPHPVATTAARAAENNDPLILILKSRPHPAFAEKIEKGKGVKDLNYKYQSWNAHSQRPKRPVWTRAWHLTLGMRLRVCGRAF